MPNSNDSGELEGLIFQFFSKFSRFEYALKKAEFLQSHVAGARAQADWKPFWEKHEAEYQPSCAAAKLIRLSPKQQVVGGSSDLKFNAIVFNANTTDLKKAIMFLKTIRNNLFHGGKSNDDGWNESKRVRKLLKVGCKLLDELAAIDCFEADYTGRH